MSNTAVDIIIPTRNRGSLIETTLSSIRNSTHANFTLWVVDQSDDHRTEACVRSHAATDPRVRYIRTETRGISAARNVGMRAGNAPFVLFTDDDCRVSPGWVSALLAELHHERVGAVFGRIVGEYTNTTHARKHKIGEIIPLAIKPSPHRATYADNRFNLGFGHGANMGISRACYQQIHGFDELLGAGGRLFSWEDRDFGFRLLREGWQIVYTPAGEIYHRQWRDWEEVLHAQRHYALGAGAAAAKYIRCGDIAGWYVLGEWLLNQGARQVLSGALKWRSSRKMLVGLQNIVYPWCGVAHALRYKVDRQRCLYHNKHYTPPCLPTLCYTLQKA